MSVTAHQKITQRSRSKHGRVGPHSALFRAGAKGSLDGRSAEARYLRDCEAQLIAHVGGAPTIAERMLIGRLARIMLRLSLLDEKIAAGQCTDYDVKVCSGLDSALRNGLSRLGLKASAQHTGPTLAEITSRIAAERRTA